ncbi:MAG: hypothetical protein LBI56_01260 [Puniceicoccales bacterium]|jgi:hypothetical protein|nr:hypothetical protein [Puniceicoccales bacterium]
MSGMTVVSGRIENQLIMEGNSSHAIQLSFVFDLKTSSFNGILRALNAQDVTIVALSFLENCETTTVRCVVNYPDVARKVCLEQKIHCLEAKVLALELDSISDLAKVSNILFSAEIKIYYMYPFLMRPMGKVGLVVQTENNEFATNILSSTGIQTLSQDNIAR